MAVPNQPQATAYQQQQAPRLGNWIHNYVVDIDRAGGVGPIIADLDIQGVYWATRKAVEVGGLHEAVRG
jgi:hypothetical protein